MFFRIDRSKWRCGGDSQYKIGEGLTQLENNQGYMCCLGQICKQLGITNIKNVACPGDLRVKIPILSFENTDETVLAERAMIINDDSNIDNSARERKLRSLFSKWKHKIEFY